MYFLKNIGLMIHRALYIARYVNEIHVFELQ